MSFIYHHQLLELLDDLEEQLKVLNLWASDHPGEAALNSVAPFCVDTLTFEQWLQFVFLPKMRALLKQGGSLPRAACLLPVAEQVYSGQDQKSRELLLIIDRIDRLSTRLVRVSTK